MVISLQYFHLPFLLLIAIYSSIFSSLSITHLLPSSFSSPTSPLQYSDPRNCAFRIWTSLICGKQIQAISMRYLSTRFYSSIRWSPLDIQVNKWEAIAFLVATSRWRHWWTDTTPFPTPHSSAWTLSSSTKTQWLYVCSQRVSTRFWEITRACSEFYELFVPSSGNFIQRPCFIGRQVVTNILICQVT
jgi:hypothetical protein